MAARRQRKGQPLAGLAMVMAAWVVVRLLLIAPSEAALPTGGMEPLAVVQSAAPALQPGMARAAADVPALPAPAGWPAGLAREPFPAPVAPSGGQGGERAPVRLAPAPYQPAFEPVPASVASGHLMLWMAAFSQVPSSALALPRREGVQPGEPDLGPGRAAGLPALLPRTAQDRWSVDSWMLLRGRGSARLAAGGGVPTYGASQAGAVLRYRLDPDSKRRPSAYLRATAALGGPREREAALGLSARPVAAVPVIVAAELRASGADHRSHRQTALRPAIMAVTEIAPIDLGGTARAEVYAQAGYVGGRNRTAFGDGQLRLDARAGQAGGAELRLGGGVWAGAQKGASRVDIGPAVTLGLPLGEGSSGRLSLDWRLRVAGDARPKSGPALTLSAGF